MTSVWTSWSGTVRARPTAWRAPTSEDEIHDLLVAAHRERRRVKVVGAGHSCSPIASPDGAELVTIERLDRVVAIDRERRRVTLEAGMTLGAACEALAQLGLALPNLPAITSQTLAGAIATGTHGTGMELGGLAASVVGARVIAPTGDVLEVEAPDVLDAVRVHLGCLGVVTRVTLQCVDAFEVACVETRMSLDAALARLATFVRAGLWWLPHVDDVIVREVEPFAGTPRARPELAAWWDGVVIGNYLHEVLLAAAARGALAIPRVNAIHARYAFPAHRRIEGPPHRVLVSTILVKQRVLEYALPLQHATAALTALRELVARERFAVSAPIDVRFSRDETAWLGLAHARASCYIGIVGYRPFGRDVDDEALFRAVDRLLRGFDGRPHWGKVHYQDARSLRALYPRFDDFLELRARLDPRGVLHNAYLERVLGSPP